MSEQFKNDMPSALKHGAYSGTSVLPGEDPAAFRDLHDRIVAEFAPNGPLEEDIVASIAMLIWRKQNLSTYRLKALQSRRSMRSVMSAMRPEHPNEGREGDLSPEEIEAAKEREELECWFEEQAETELVIATDYLLKELQLVDRLDGMIDRSIKRLLMVRGFKSISAPASATPTPKRLAAV